MAKWPHDSTLVLIGEERRLEINEGIVKCGGDARRVITVTEQHSNGDTVIILSHLFEPQLSRGLSEPTKIAVTHRYTEGNKNILFGHFIIL